MKSKFKSGDIVAARDKLFIIKQGLANSMQQKSWSDVWYEYLAYRVRNNEISTKKVYVLKESEIRKAMLPPDSTEEIAKSIHSFEHSQEEFQKGDIVWREGKLYCIDNINLKIKKLVPNSMFCETFVDTNYMAYPMHYDSHNSSYVIKKEGRTSICGSESEWIGASDNFFNCVSSVSLKDGLSESEVKSSISSSSYQESNASVFNDSLQKLDAWHEGEYVRVKGEGGVYRILRVGSSSCWLDKLIIKGNNISVDIIPVRKDYEKLEHLSSYEESLLRRESKPKVMRTIAQELRLEEMNKRFVESMSKYRDKQEDAFKEEISRNKLHSHIEAYTNELEEEALESFKRKYLAANTSLLDKAFIKVRELIRDLLDSIKSVLKPQQKNDEALINTEVLQTIYAYVDGTLPCSIETRDKLAVFVSEYKKINSEDEKGHVINKIGDTVKTIHYELERDKSDIEKVNKIIDSMIEYIRLVNESSKSNVDTKLELEHDYMKKLLEDTRNAKRVAQGDTKSFEDIVKEDSFEIK